MLALSRFAAYAVVGLALLAGPGNTHAQVTGEWVTPRQWPHRLELPAAETARLVVIEERGSNLALLLPGGEEAFVPDRRHTGLELWLAPAGEITMPSLMPRYSNMPASSFRVTAYELTTTEQYEAAQALSRAGVLGASVSLADLNRSCASYEAVAEREGVPRAWIDTAILLAVSCNLDIGRANSADLLERFDTVGATLGLLPYHTEWLRGRHYYLQGQFERATGHYEESLNILGALTPSDEPELSGIEQDKADILNDLAITLVVRAYRTAGAERTSQLDQAKELFDQAMTLAGKHQNHLVLSNIYNYIAQRHLVEGNDRSWIDNLHRSLAEAELLEDPDEELFVLGSIGDYYKQWGRFRPALDAYLRAVRILEEGSRRIGRGGDTYHNLAKLYNALGDLPRARELTERAIEVDAPSNNPYRSNILYYELGTIVEEQGDLLSAKALLERQVAYMETRETPWEPVRMMTQAALSRVEGKLGNHAEALRLSNENFAHTDILQNANRIQAIPVYVNHAQLLFADGDTEGSIALLDKVLTEVAVQPSDKVEILANMLSIYQQEEQTAEAIETAERAFALIEDQQTQLETARLGPYWSAKTHAVYMDHADYLLERQQAYPDFLERAFIVVERGRAASLRLRRQEVLLASIEQDPVAEQEWRQLMEAVQSGFTNNQSDADALALDRRISEARERFYAEHGNAGISTPLQPLPLAETIQHVPGDTLLLEFVAGPVNFWRFELSSDGWNVSNLGLTREIQTMVDATLYELQQSNRRRQNLQQLSTHLLAGLSIEKDWRHLLISPTAELNPVPFAALQYRGEYLGSRATLTLIPSVSEYFSQGPLIPSRPYSREIAVLADPSFGEFSQTLAMVDNDEVFRSWTSSLSPLPYTAREAAALERFYPESDRLILTGSSATPSRFFSPGVRNARIIHLATHGYFNEQLPELIGFALSNEGTDDGFVSMAEISAEHFNADLVVISACSTAQGEILPGEGAMSLGRTFLAQGVNSVISTLWPVSDRATALFMEEFYRAINNDGASYAQALHRAQQLLRDSDDYRSPAYWAAYTLTTVKSPQ